MNTTDPNEIFAERLSAMEREIENLKADRDRFLNALKGAAEMCLKNPVVVSMLPKAMKNDLKNYLGMN